MITIILLLILSALAINIILGQNGLLNKTKYAKNVYENAQQKENEELNKIYGQLLVTSDGTINNISVEILKELIKKEIKAELENISVGSNSIGSILAQMGEKAPEG